jgi:hypothetical protein
MRVTGLLLIGLGVSSVVLGGCAHRSAHEAPPVGTSTAPVMPAPLATPAASALPAPAIADRAQSLLPARLQIVARFEVERLAAAFGGRERLLELLPQRNALEPAQWQRLLQASELIWFGVDLRNTDARGYPDRLLVLSGDFAAQAAALVEPPAAVIAAPSPVGVAEPVWAEAFGTRHTLVGRQVWHHEARSALSDPNARRQPPPDFGPDTASTVDPAGAMLAAFELWAMLDEPSVREWTGPFADAFLRPLVLQLGALTAVQVSFDPGPDTTTLRVALHPRDPGQLETLQAALQTVLDSVRMELVDPGQRALFGEPRALLVAGQAQVSWTLPSALVVGHARSMLR